MVVLSHLRARKMNIDILVLAVALLLVACLGRSQTLDIDLTAKGRLRNEGKITLEFTSREQIVKHQLAYNEIIDSIDGRYKTSIGYISYEPTIYTTTGSDPAITADKSGCKVIEHPSTLIPELSWLTDTMFPKVDIKEALKDTPHLVGPSGLVAALMRIADHNSYKNMGKVMYRNIKCDLWTKTLRLSDNKTMLQSEVYLMGESTSNMSPSYDSYSISIMALNLDNLTPSKADSMRMVSRFIIDVYSSEQVAETDRDLEKLDIDLSQPLAIGCSEYLDAIEPTLDVKSFSMTLKPQSSQIDILVAYDSSRGYLRKEVIGTSLNIWDIEENLLYYINTKPTVTPISNDAKTSEGYTLNICSVLDVHYDLGKAFRPFKDNNEPFNILQLIGDRDLHIAYMGRGEARSLPCYIFEVIVKTAPAIFGLVEPNQTPANSEDRDYLLQYYLIQNGAHKYGSKPKLSEDQFRPIQIKLYRRKKVSVDSDMKIDLVDILDIYDFHWSLDGWEKKSSELFMAGECFGEQTEQRRIGLTLRFDDIHNGMPDTQLASTMVENRFKLEYQLINWVFSSIGISKLHLVEYDLNFEKHHIDFNMVIADRNEELTLKYRGSEYLENCKTLDNTNTDCISLPSYQEDECVSMGSLVKDAQVVAYCQDNGSDGSHVSHRCLVYRNNSPQPKKQSDSTYNPGQMSCKIYDLGKVQSPKRVTINLSKDIADLRGKQFEFKTSALGQPFMAMIDHYEVNQEYQVLKFDNRKYVKTTDDNTNKVRIFESMTANSLGDCMKICNFDIDCKSYSYCPMYINTDQVCIISSLDIREQSVRDQLSRPITSQKNESPKVVRIQDPNSPDCMYQLEVADGCVTYERDYLNMFNNNGEQVRITKSLALQLSISDTAFDCSRLVIQAESESSSHIGSMFAFCPETKSCILHEKLLGEKPLEKSKSSEDDNEVICGLYRRQFHAYFHVSLEIFKPDPDTQILLNLDSVEECAHACWQQFGQVCASFDFCSNNEPNACVLNRRSIKSLNEPLNIIRSKFMGAKKNCLHYERDLKLDELRRALLVGRHQILDPNRELVPFSARLIRYSLSGIFYTLLFLIFVTGLFTGGVISERLEAVTILRQSISAGPGRRFSEVFGFSMRANTNTNTLSTLELIREDHDDLGAIQLQDLGGEMYQVGWDQLVPWTQEGDNLGPTCSAAT